jgi:5-methyltetrahydrofolate--homocysteine methyltransferase
MKYGAAVVALTIDEEGMAKTRERKVAIAERILDATRKHALPDEDVLFDCLTFTLGSGDEEFRTAGIETIEAIRALKSRAPAANTILGISNISFGLKPAARHVLNSVFLHHCLDAGLSSAIVHAGKILPENKVDPSTWRLAEDVVFDKRKPGYDPLVAFMAAFEGVTSAVASESELASLDVEERLKRHVIDGAKTNLNRSLDEALERYAPLEIINSILLDGMKTVGDLFGAGKMQLPFVLQSAEVMKAAVSYLEPHMAKLEGTDRGSILLATVAGDVHDIGKNLVDIILSNNGYRVVNIGIKQPIGSILSEAEAHNVDVIGMSGLLVKSTVVMKENLAEMNDRGLEKFPVVLGGAALTRAYVEQDLRDVYKGPLYYAQDAFEGLRIMETLGSSTEELEIPPRVASSRVSSHRLPDSDPEFYNFDGAKSSVSTATEIPTAPWIGRRTVTDVSLDDIYPYVNEIALFRGQWGFKRPKEMGNPEFSAYLEEHARPAFDRLKDDLRSVLEPKVVYGYFPAQSCGNDLIIYREHGDVEIARFRFPRQREDRRLCIADFFAPTDSGRMDVAAFQLVTIGPGLTQLEQKLFADGHYQEYLYVHGMGVECAEALAEYWHKQVRHELAIADDDADDIRLLFSTKYRGCRYSFGYPACPNLEDQAILFGLLGPDEIGVSLTEEFMCVPEQSTSAIVCHHPEAKYFNLR